MGVAVNTPELQVNWNVCPVTASTILNPVAGNVKKIPDCIDVLLVKDTISPNNPAVEKSNKSLDSTIPAVADICAS
jgi:hypothetical protein